MYATTHANPSSAMEHLTTQMLRAQEMKERFQMKSEQFRHWMSSYHQQMQRFYTKKLGYHERMEQLYKDQLLDDIAPRWEIAPVEIDALAPPATALLAEIDAANTGEANSDVTGMQWTQIASLLPLGKGRGRPYVDDRRTLNGILFVTTHHVGWSHMPPRYGSYVTCWRRYLRWQSRGVWSEVQHILQQTVASEQQDSPAYGAARSDNMAYAVYASS